MRQSLCFVPALANRTRQDSMDAREPCSAPWEPWGIPRGTAGQGITARACPTTLAGSKAGLGSARFKQIVRFWKRRKIDCELPNPFSLSPWEREIFVLESQSQKWDEDLSNFTSVAFEHHDAIFHYTITVFPPLLCFFLHSSASLFRMKNVYKTINSSVFSHIYLTASPMLSFFGAFSEAYSEEAFDIFMGFSVASITTNE